ncbi:MAG: TonB-dependent receptor [Bacteroidia bacterium]|nr:TonB-dependent receptor [Bacteroidia bacterium]
MSQKNLVLALLLFCNITIVLSQNDTINLEEVIISTNRISIPYFKTSRTITLISKDAIKKYPATNVADLLQHVAGVDVRRRGVDGTQTDLYIRGGNFDQTLLLIDGIKLDDAQTGHHTMNSILSIENIERIEIIKGPAARVFGQNAFAGAINIVTKRNYNNSLKANVAYGSYNNIKGSIGLREKFENGGIQIHLEKQKSDGYRFNTDFDNTSVFLKTNINNYQLLTSFNDRKFGANGFYASPDFVDQYEETQTSLVAISTDYQIKNLVIKPRISWRRNQDMYLFLREDPDFFRNLHISNKVSAEANSVLSTKLGETGFGIDLSKIYLASNNLGDHNRFMFTTFLEHRFAVGNKFDITPGIAISYFSDFNTKAFPGLDLGYEISDKLKLYGNIGYTYRIPTYTDLYYVGPTTQGNPELKPESALSEEIGLKFTIPAFQFNIALFNRNSDDLIDWTKDNEDDKWETRNFSNVITKGLETTVNYKFNIGKFDQQIILNYNFIDDRIKDENVVFTRYSLNSLKHQLTSTINTQFLSFLDQSISFRLVERTNGESYNVIDSKVKASFNKWEFFVLANNIFNTEYTETNLVPMPKSNVMFGVSFMIY